MNHTPKENMQHLVQEMLDPNGVDVVVTGTFVDLAKQDAVRIFPMVVSRTKRHAMSKKLEFHKSEFTCSALLRPSKKRFCQNVREEIAKAVKELLEAL
jgi:hypothetical protein